MKDIKNDFTSSLSIKQPGKKENEKLVADEDYERNEAITPFTPAELYTYWDEYAEKLRKEFPHLYSALHNSRPKLLPDWKIEFAIENKLIGEELNLKKPEMMEFLRNRLNNFRIQLHTRILENQKDLKPYTDKEKFDKLVEKNPALLKLREELDLGIDY